MEVKGLLDDKGVIAKACKLLPPELSHDMIESLSELENNEAHRTRTFPKTRLHKVEGIKDIYRADIDKISGWRFHVQYGKDNIVNLCDVLTGNEHDRVGKVVKSRKHRYAPK